MSKIDEIFAKVKEEKKSLKKELMGEKIAELRKQMIKEVKEEVKFELPKQALKDVRPDLLKILQDPNLFENVNKEFDKFIVGEKKTRQTIFLCGCGKYVLNAQESSYNLIVNSESGAGKDWVTKYVLKIFPKEETIMRKGISPTAFRYWHNAKFEPEWTWDGKIFYCEDVPNNVLNCDVFKVMASSGNTTSTITINNRAFDIVIIGKPVVIITTATANPSQENLRRFSLAKLDETIPQTEAIMQRQAKYKAKGITLEYDKLITEALGCLNGINVRIPFAEKLVGYLPKDNLIMRTAFPRFLDYIASSVALHQYQRKHDREGFFLATEQDYKIGRMALLKTTSNNTLIPLTKDQEKILRIIVKMGDYNHSITDLATKITFFGDSQLRRHLDKLTTLGFLYKDTESREGSRSPVIVYRYKDLLKLDIPENMENMTTMTNMKTMKIMTNTKIEENDGKLEK